MRAALACLVAGALVACFGKGGGGGPAKPKGPVGPAIDAKEAEQGASDLVAEIYQTLGRGNKDSLFTLLDDALIVFGPRGADMLGTRADALVALGQVMDPKAKKNVVIRRGKLEVVAAPGGRSAWVFDNATINGQPHTVMAVLTNANDLWLVRAVAVARAPAMQQVKAELAKDAVVPPGAAGMKQVDPDARPAIEKFQKGLLDQAMWGEDLASRTDAVVVGPTAGEVARGKKDIKALWKKRVDAKTRAAISGELTARVTDDGQLAWISAPITRVEGEGDQPIPLRAFALYEKDGADWTLIALHESLAIGEPGAGAAFKKVVPPKPVEPKPAEVIADKPKDGKDAKNAKNGKNGKAKPAEIAKDKPKAKQKEKAAAAPEPPKKKPKPSKPAEEPAPPKQAKAKLAKADDDDDDDEAPKKKKKKPPPPAEDDEDEIVIED